MHRTIVRYSALFSQKAWKVACYSILPRCNYKIVSISKSLDLAPPPGIAYPILIFSSTLGIVDADELVGFIVLEKI
jgi:hypothetical protein